MLASLRIVSVRSRVLEQVISAETRIPNTVVLRFTLPLKWRKRCRSRAKGVPAVALVCDEAGGGGQQARLHGIGLG